MKKILIQAIKFFLCTQVAWWLDVAVFSLMFEVIGLDEIVAKAISYSCGAILSYILNRKITFKNKKKVVITLPRFVIINLLALSASLGSMAIMSKALGFHEWLAYLLSVVFSFSVNYCGNRFWVFYDKKKKGETSKNVG